MTGNPPGPLRYGDQSGDPLRRLDGEVDRDHAAARAADDGRLVDTQVIQHRARIGSVGELDVFGLRLTEASRVVADDVVVPGQRLHLGIPHAQCGDSGVNQQ